MDQLDATLRAVSEAVKQGRIGTTVAARIMARSGDGAGSFDSAAGRSLSAAAQWFGAKPSEIIAQGNRDAQHAIALARFPGGQTALIGVAGHQAKQAPLGVAVFGSHGIISLDLAESDFPASASVSDSASFDSTAAELAQQFHAAWNQSATDSPGSSKPLKRYQTAAPKAPLKPPYGVLLVTGNFSHQEDYARQFAADPRCKLIGLTDVGDLTKRRKDYNADLAKELKIPLLPDFDAAIRRDDVHLICICAEPDRRASIIVRCASAGKHLYLDKPLCVSIKEIDEITAACEKSGMVHQMFSLVHLPHAGKIRRIVESGEIGKLVGIHADLTFAKGPNGTADLNHPRREVVAPTDVELRDTKRELTNVGVYPLVLLHWLLGERVTSVAATTGNYFFAEHQHNGQEDFGQILMTTESGVVASISAGRTGWKTHASRGLDCTYLIGTKGIAVVDAHRPRFNVFGDEEPWHAPARHPEDPMGFWRSTAPPRAKNEWILPADPQSTDQVHFLNRVERGEASDVPASIAGAATEVLLAAYKSAATGKIVKLPLPR